MPWSNVECHTSVRDSIQRSIDKGMLDGTHLFYGPPGGGQLQVAMALAKTLLCHSVENDFCDQCNICRRVNQQTYPDVFVLFPDVDWSDEKRKGRDYSIGHMRVVQQTAQSQPYEGNKKIFIVNNSERLRIEAANCLLKTLEEPHKHVLFILLTDNLSRILPTILSRCRKIRLPQLPMNEVVSSLQDDMTSEQAETLARASGGFPERARLLLEDSYLEQRDEVLSDLQRLKDDPAEINSVVDSWNKKKEVLPSKMLILSSLLRDGLVIAGEGQEGILTNPDQRTALETLWAGIPPQSIMLALEKLIDAQESLDRYVNSALILNEVLMLALSKNPVSLSQ